MSASFYTGRKEQTLAYTEKKSKRLIGHYYDKTKDEVMEAHRNRSPTPDRPVLGQENHTGK